IGLSGQSHGLVLVGHDDAVLRPAILWPDLRTGAEVERLTRLPGERRLPLCNPIVTGMAGMSLAWIKGHEPVVLDRARAALSPKDWLRLKLTARSRRSRPTPRRRSFTT